ncbi:MAG: hypothetical protein PHV74_00600 [Dehalococcoidia bacterium]|nr:hypothetical protein [Dehalococcoidia bacterium]
MHLSNIRSMYAAVEVEHGFDVIIIVSSSHDQADFWQKRLQSSRGTVTPRKTQVISVEEDWPGGAGQLLGTLYAFQKASSILNLHQILAGGGTIAMYHTAGKGTRMAPITAAEANNKSAIKLPRLIEIDGIRTPLTVLEAVIFQTGIFADSRPGRLGVFWGDQVFIPSRSANFEGNHHAEILDIRDQIPADEESWKSSWQSYGLIIPDAHGDALQREKQCWDDLRKLTAVGLIKPDASGRVILGKSLGCFSVSHNLLSALLEEFAAELTEKRVKMDTDPHLWMPLTSTREQFTSAGGSPALWDRLDQFKQRFMTKDQQRLRLFGDKDVGNQTLWWDYGQLRLYHQNFLKALEDSFEGACLRQFYNLESHHIQSCSKDGLTVENSIIVNSHIKGKVKDSVLLGVEADHLDSTASAIMSSHLGRARIDGALIYGCIDLNEMALNTGEVAADVFMPSLGQMRMRTEIRRDGKEDWDRLICGNPYTFESLSRLVGSQSESGIVAERSKRMGHYKNREKIKSLARSFIKPATDNLVEIVWGGDHIEKMKGLPPSGKKIAESWECSSHPQHPSTIHLQDGSAIPLSDLLALMSEDILGHQMAEEFIGRLPILFKFLDAREDLSVQVHPSDEKARELGESDTGKTEAWVVLKAEKGAVLYLGFKEDVNESEFEKDLSSPRVNIAQKYLTPIEARVGDVLINPTGTVHAIGKGVVLAEIQQSSGITYRVWDWNRVPQRPLHIAKAMASLNFKKTGKADFELTPIRISDKEERLIDSFYFSLDRLRLAYGDALDADTKGGFQILTCLEGKCDLIGEGSKAAIGQWESALVPASIGQYKIAAKADSVLLRSFVLAPQQIDPVIFQTYDVRAIADKYLSDRVCYYLGKGFGTFLRREQGGQPQGIAPTVTVGGGVRLSTERIRQQLIKGICSTGVNVLDVGVTTTPELYFSIPYLNADGGINITASHNEAEYNGLKQVIRSADGFITSINADQMLEIKRTVLEGDFLEGEGKYTKIEEGEVVRYHNELVKANCRLGRAIWIELLQRWQDKGLKALLDVTSKLDFPEKPDKQKWAQIRQTLDLPADIEQPATAIKHPFEGLIAVIDFGNGSAWRTAEVYSDLGAEVVALNDFPDGSFPAHMPDPIKAKYRKQLEAAVMKEAARSKKEVIGIGNDEDADRVIYVRSDGRVVEGDRTLAIQAKPIIEEHVRLGKPGKPRFLGEVKFSRVAEEYITSLGGEYILSPTGFAFIKDGTKALARALRAGEPEIELFGRKINLRENKEPIALAAELSGHQMAGHEENWIFDDALLASIKVLSAIADGLKEGKTFIDLDEAVPRYPATPELNIRLGTNILAEKQEVVDAVLKIFRRKGYPIDTTDGGLIKWLDKGGKWLGQALVRKSNTQPMIICRVEGKDEKSQQVIEDEFFKELSKVSTKTVPKLNLASDDYIKGILPRVIG